MKLYYVDFHVGKEEISCAQMEPGNKGKTFMCAHRKLVWEFVSVRFSGLEFLCLSDTFSDKLLQLNPLDLSCLIEAMKVGSTCIPMYARQIRQHLSSTLKFMFSVG